MDIYLYLCEVNRINWRMLNKNGTICKQIIKTFLSITGLSADNLEYKISEVPHLPYSKPKGQSAIYIFIYKNVCLKVGKAGPNSYARFNSHHYCNNKTKSSLFGSILKNKLMLKNINGDRDSTEIANLNEDSLGKWIKENTSRCDILIKESDKFSLNLLEALAQYYFKPVYEGKDWLKPAPNN